MGRELFTSDLTERPRGAWSLPHHTGAICIHMLERKNATVEVLFWREAVCFRTSHLFN